MGDRAQSPRRSSRAIVEAESRERIPMMCARRGTRMTEIAGVFPLSVVGQWPAELKRRRG